MKAIAAKEQFSKCYSLTCGRSSKPKIQREGKIITINSNLRFQKFDKIISCLMWIFLLIKTKPDVIHIHGIGSALMCLFAKIFLRHDYTLIFTHHDLGSRNADNNVCLRFCYAVFEEIARFADHQYTVTEQFRSEVRLIYPGFTAPSFTDVQEGLRIFKELSLKEKDHVVAVGRHSYSKGTVDLIKSLKHVSTPVQLFLVGPLTDEIRKLLNEAEMHGKSQHVVTYVGSLPHGVTIAFMQQAKVFVSASHYEAYGLAVDEAVSVGLLCVLSDIPAHKRHTQNAIFFNKKDAVDLAKSIDKTLKDFDKYSCRTCVHVQRSWEDVADEYYA